MKDFFGRYRDLVGISVLLVLPLVALFYSGRDREKLKPLANGLSTLAVPIQLVGDAAFSTVADLWRGYVDLVGAKSAAERLQKEVEALTGELLRLKRIEIENRRLKGLCEFKRDQDRFRYVAARVIGWSPSPAQDVMKIVLDRGEADGVRAGAPVVTHEGLVGRIERLTGGVAEVMLLVDPRSRLNVKIAEKGVTGTLVGSGDRDRFTARLLHVQKGSDIDRLDTVVTSGFDGLFPPDLEVGYVMTEATQQTGLFYEVPILPAVDFGRLQEVLVVLGAAEPARDKADKGDKPDRAGGRR